jgi:hypothetical protein
MTAKKDGDGGNKATRRDTAGHKLAPQAHRALEEAAARRAAQIAAAKTAAEKGVRAKKEIGGGDGPEPIRYGDWEVKGRARDF